MRRRMGRRSSWPTSFVQRCVVVRQICRVERCRRVHVVSSTTAGQRHDFVRIRKTGHDGGIGGRSKQRSNCQLSWVRTVRGRNGGGTIVGGKYGVGQAGRKPSVTRIQLHRSFRIGKGIRTGRQRSAVQIWMTAEQMSQAGDGSCRVGRQRVKLTLAGHRIQAWTTAKKSEECVAHETGTAQQQTSDGKCTNNKKCWLQKITVYVRFGQIQQRKTGQVGRSGGTGRSGPVGRRDHRSIESVA